MYIFTTCAAILANLVKNKRKMKIFLKKSAIYFILCHKICSNRGQLELQSYIYSLTFESDIY